MIGRLTAALLTASLGGALPAVGQTVIYPDPPPARADSARPQPPRAPGDTIRRDTVRRDTVRRDTTRAAPAPYGITPAPAAPPRQPAAPAEPAPPPPPPDPILARVCTDAGPGEPAPDVLGIVFERDAPTATREAALAAVEGKRLGGSAEDQFQYVQVPAGESEFRLRTLADKLIRRSGVSEVGPVTCPARSLQPDTTAPPR